MAQLRAMGNTYLMFVKTHNVERMLQTQGQVSDIDLVAAIENANTIEERRSEINRNSVSIAICRPTGDKWQSKTLFLSIFDPRSSIVDDVFDCRPPGVL